MDSIGLKGRMILFGQRFWQPASACLTCMPGSLTQLTNLSHWEIALQTGLGTGSLVLVLTFLPSRAVFRHRYGNAIVVALLTMLGDAYSHRFHDGIRWKEVILTGFTSGLFALVASFLFQDRARRLRSLWSMLRGA
jgi:hypothetical protein